MKLEEAATLNDEAMRLVREGKPTHASVSASHYRQGCVRLLAGKYDDALQELHKAHAICQLNEPTRGNAGESARVMWRMAQIYEHDGKVDEARTFLDVAEKIRNDLLATGDYAQVEDVEDSWDCLVGLLYR